MTIRSSGRSAPRIGRSSSSPRIARAISTDALTRRCIYHWIEFPGAEQVLKIVRRRVEGAAEPIIVQATETVRRLRGLDLVKPPGVAELIDWVSALSLLA